MKTCFGLLALCLISFSVWAIHSRGEADPPLVTKPPPTEYECRWTDTPIVIDGKPDDEAWKHAQVIDQFYLPWLRPQRFARTKTTARLLWDREYLYFCAQMEDSDGERRAAR